MSVLDTFSTGEGREGKFFSLPKLAAQGHGGVGRLPVSIRIVLESLLRNCDGKRVREEDVKHLADWKPNAPRTEEVPFVVARVLLQDFTGVPLLVDLAAMRTAAQALGKDPKKIEPLVPVDLVVDHSVQVDHYASATALDENLKIEFARNQQRYEFLKWGAQAFETFGIVPPGMGICHQVNLEYLAQVVREKDGVFFPDTLVGTDSHTTMINGLGIVAWGVGGIEAEAAMLGQPVYFLMPDVVGLELKGSLPPGVTATDLVLTVTELLRKAKVVGKFVEFFGEGAAALSAQDRATLANMAPEYGATMGFFPPDEKTLDYLAATGRPAALVDTVRNYLKAQGLLGVPRAGACDYSQSLSLDLGSITPSVAGPKRPQDRVALADLKGRFAELLAAPAPDGFGRSEAERTARHNVTMAPHDGHPAAEAPLGDGAVLIAAITSCTNTSNPSVILGAGLLAKKAVEKGLRSAPWVKTSLGPGSRAVSAYLEKTGLQAALDQLGFQAVGYGCTTCIGNSGPLDTAVEEKLKETGVVGASVLSGNRNFEARVHQFIKANFLMSPPLVVAFALAGRVDIDLSTEPLGTGRDGQPVFLKDIWPTSEEIQALWSTANDAETFRKIYAKEAQQTPLWTAVKSPAGDVYAWDAASTYVQQPPFFEGFGPGLSETGNITGARVLAVFGDSVTTDHISPAGAIKPTSPAGLFLQQKGVGVKDFNSYGARRGNHEVMMRGTFANVRIKNQLLPGTEGGLTRHALSGQEMAIYDAAMDCQAQGVPLFIFAGAEYGTGSSRDWAAKGTALLGVKAVFASSFERIHRSNLAGMGVLPCQFAEGLTAASLGLKGDETFDLLGLEKGLSPKMTATLVIHGADGVRRDVPVTVRVDTPIEVEYFRHGGILPYVLRQIVFEG